jgi:hypothetical protein
VPGGKAEKSPRPLGGLASRRAATGIPASTTDGGNSPSEQTAAEPGVGQHRRASRRSDVAVPEAADPFGHSTITIAWLLAQGSGAFRSYPVLSRM